jgi:putative Mg2+ transporter-C (MgtC) family protein
LPLLAGSLSETLWHMVSLAAAYALALPIGWDREKEERSAGVRTFPLVAIASCGFVLIAIAVLGRASLGQARILEGLITGVGFIGGGAILKQGSGTSGTATAASLWATGAVGAAVGYSLYDIAIIISAVTFLTLRLSRPLKQAAGEQGDNVDTASTLPGRVDTRPEPDAG